MLCGTELTTPLAEATDAKYPLGHEWERLQPAEADRVCGPFDDFHCMNLCISSRIRITNETKNTNGILNYNVTQPVIVTITKV